MKLAIELFLYGLLVAYGIGGVCWSAYEIWTTAGDLAKRLWRPKQRASFRKRPLRSAVAITLVVLLALVVIFPIRAILWPFGIANRRSALSARMGPLARERDWPPALVALLEGRPEEAERLMDEEYPL